MRRLWIACCNCLSLSSPFQELRTDITILTGTGRRSWDGMDHFVEPQAQGFAVHFGWQKGKWTNKSAGCAILFGKDYTLNQIIKVEAAPAKFR